MSAAAKPVSDEERVRAHQLLDACMDAGLTGTVEIHLKRGRPIGAQKHESVQFDPRRPDLMRQG